ncbi:hypothetical protein NMY22_g7484 [Coprinellus aureogranulatus]|nr:hypothetical protein NMY22_g7484 [Coprinellus aureogranulatus]
MEFLRWWVQEADHELRLEEEEEAEEERFALEEEREDGRGSHGLPDGAFADRLGPEGNGADPVEEEWKDVRAPRGPW